MRSSMIRPRRVYLKKKKIAKTINAMVAEPKADKIPIKMPLPVEPVELPPAATTRSGSYSDEMLEMTCWRLFSICCRDRDDALCTAVGTVWEETSPSGDVVGLPITVLRVEGRPVSTPGPDASRLCIVHRLDRKGERSFRPRINKKQVKTLEEEREREGGLRRRLS